MSRSRAASLASIFLVVFIDLLGFGIVLPLLARYGKYFEADAWLGALVASFSAMQFLFAPLWGRLSDRIGRRPVLLVGLLGSAGFYALFGVATGMPKDATLLGLGPLAWLFISRCGAGIAGATIPTAQAYIADVTGREERAKGMALIGAAFGIGFTFGPMLGAVVVSDDPHAAPSPYAGYLASALSAAAFLACAAFLKEPERHLPIETTRPAGRWGLLGETVRVALFGEIFLTTAAFAMFESTLTLLSQRLGYSDRDNFWLFAFIGVTLTVAQGLLVRRLAPRLRERRMAPIGLVLLAAGLAGLAFIGPNELPTPRERDQTTAPAVATAGGMSHVETPRSDEPPTPPARRLDRWFYAALVLCVVGFAFVTPSLQSLLSLTTPADKQGAVLGLGQSANALARIAGPVAGVWLFQRSVPLAYGTAAAVMLASLAAIFPVLTIIRRHAEQNSPDGAANMATPAVAE